MEFFSERNGLTESIDTNYSSAFRSAVVTSFLNQYKYRDGELLYVLKEVMDLFGIEQKPQLNDTATLLHNKEQTLLYFASCPWNHLFDFIEYVLMLDPQRSDILEEKYNKIFRFHGCKYRLLNKKAIPIVNDLEINEMNKALHTGVDSTDTAYNEAIALLANKNDPDYNAVIAKTSNALESMVITIANDNFISANTLGKAIKELEKKGIIFDKDMKAIIDAVYVYACNAGLRHGGMNSITATEEDAIFIMVISAAAINYLNELRLH